MSSQDFDIVLLTRGAWRGFCILLIGGLVQPLVLMASRPLGFWWLAVVAVVAFVVAAAAAVRPGIDSLHRMQGAAAALASYLLVVPLVVMGSHTFDVVQVACTTALAVLVGTVVGLARMRTPIRGR